METFRPPSSWATDGNEPSDVTIRAAIYARVSSEQHWSAMPRTSKWRSDMEYPFYSARLVGTLADAVRLQQVEIALRRRADLPVGVSKSDNRL
jgi:hypothetical protein